MCRDSERVFVGWVESTAKPNVFETSVQPTGEYRHENDRNKKANDIVRKLERSIAFGYVFGLSEVSKALGYYGTIAVAIRSLDRLTQPTRTRYSPRLISTQPTEDYRSQLFAPLITHYSFA